MSQISIEDEAYDASPDETVLAVANRENHYLGEICFKGNCAGCLIELNSDDADKLDDVGIKEKQILRLLQKSPKNFRLACQAKIKELPLKVYKPMS